MRLFPSLITVTFNPVHNKRLQNYLIEYLFLKIHITSRNSWVTAGKQRQETADQIISIMNMKHLNEGIFKMLSSKIGDTESTQTLNKIAWWNRGYPSTLRWCHFYLLGGSNLLRLRLFCGYDHIRKRKQKAYKQVIHIIHFMSLSTFEWPRCTSAML